MDGNNIQQPPSVPRLVRLASHFNKPEPITIGARAFRKHAPRVAWPLVDVNLTENAYCHVERVAHFPQAMAIVIEGYTSSLLTML